MLQILASFVLVSVWSLTAVFPPAVHGQFSHEASGDTNMVTIPVTVDGVDPGTVEILPGGKAQATISGGSLNRSGLSLEVRKSDGSTAGGKVTAGLKSAAGSSKRTMTVRAKGGAAPGRYRVTLKGPDTNIPIPLQVTVTAPIVPLSGKMTAKLPAAVPVSEAQPPAAAPGTVKKTAPADLKGRMTASREKSRAFTRIPVPASPSTGPLSYTPTAPGSVGVGAFGRRRPSAAPLSYTETAPADPSRKSFGTAAAPAEPADEGVPVMVDFSHLAGTGKIVMPEVVLEVRLLYGDLEKWGAQWTGPRAGDLEFRWQSTTGNISRGRWEVAQDSGFGSIVLSGDAGAAPEPGGYRRFRVDFGNITGMFSDFFVRLRPLRGQSLGAASGAEGFSPAVRVTIANSTADPTEFTDPAMGGPVVLPLAEPPVIELGEPEPVVVPLAEPPVVELGAAPSVEIPLPGPTGEAPLPVPGKMVPKEGEPVKGPPIAFPSGGFVHLWKTKLHARQGSGDFAQWGALYSESDPMPVTFRWMTEVGELSRARLQVSRKADFSEIVKGAKVEPVPLPGKQQLFTVDFRTIVDTGERPLTYHVRLLPRLKKTADPGTETPQPSNSVIVRITGPGPDTAFQMPTITDFMPFSSCSPGGVIILKGYDFGEEAGTLRLMGNFPGGVLDLKDLEWTEHSVGGKVPMIKGVLDHQVGVKLVTKRGHESDAVPCAFKATRELTTIPFPGGFSSRRCEKGDNADTGRNQVFPDVSGDGWALISDEMANGDVWFGCRHSNNSQGGDNRGTDTFSTVWLQNGWVFHSMTFGHSSSYVNHDPGQVLSFTGWKEGKRQLDLRVSWFVPEGQHFRYSMKLFMEGPAGVPFKD